MLSSRGVGGEFGPFHDSVNAPAAVYPKLLSWLPVPPDENTATRYSDVDDHLQTRSATRSARWLRDAVPADGERSGRIGGVEHGDADAGERITVVEHAAGVMRNGGEVDRSVAAVPAARRHDARRGAIRQDRPVAGQAGPAARHDACSTLVAAGVRPSMRAIERYDVNVIGLTLSKNQQAHVEKRVRRIGQPAKQARAAAGLGAVRRAGRPDRVDRRVRALRSRPLRRLLQEDLSRAPARRRHNDAAHDHQAQR